MRVLQVQRFLWLLTPMLTAPILAQGPDSARTLVGWVSDSAATPVTLADVEVVGLGRHAQTDSKGRFRLEKIPTGPTTLRVRRLGFLPITMSVPAVHTEGDSLHVVLLAAAAKLPELKVEAEGGDVFNRAKYADFFRRRTLGIGTFRYGPEIERMHAMHTPELLRDIPGVHLSFGTIAAGVAKPILHQVPTLHRAIAQHYGIFGRPTTLWKGRADSRRGGVSPPRYDSPGSGSSDRGVPRSFSNCW